MNEKKNEIRGVFVERRDNEDMESLIKRFKKKVSKSGILQDLKRKAFYIKPSEYRKKKSLDARRRNEKEHAKNLKINGKIRKRSKDYENSRSDL